jgi:hypothetical protein
MIIQDNIYNRDEDNIYLSTTSSTTQLPTINKTYLSPMYTTDTS